MRRIRLVGTLAALLLVGVACSADDVATSGEDAAPAPGAPSMDGGWAGDEDAGYDDGEVPSDWAGGAPEVPPDARSEIRTGYLVLETADPVATYERVLSETERLGGFVESSDLSRDREQVLRGSVTIRIPAESLAGLMDALDEDAEAVPAKQIDSRDVTGQLVDLDARLANLRTYEQQLQEVMVEVEGTPRTRAEDLLAVFDRVQQVREEIERLDAQRSLLREQVAYSTLRVELIPTRDVRPLTDPEWSFTASLRDAWSAGLRTATAVVDALLYVVVGGAPVLIPLALIAAVVWRLLRRRFRDRDRDDAAV
jgi:hypothetical protein